MVMRDTIFKVDYDYIKDARGGRKPVEGSEIRKAIDCKVSITNDINFATQYGVATDDVLVVVSRTPLVSGDSFYENCGKRFKCRGCRTVRNLYYSTLVVVKQ